MQPAALGAVVAALVLLSWIVGRLRSFLNTSTLAYLYGSRLVRAYLGAANPDRLQGRWRGVTETVPSDDLPQEEYWSPQHPGKYQKGAPLHLVNVTINETYGGRSEIEQRDRKGRGMAIGPTGISVRVKDHVVWQAKPATGKPELDPSAIYNGVSIFPPKDPDADRAFDYTDDVYTGQRLALGSWTGISGAAASTGLGHLTSWG